MPDGSKLDYAAPSKMMSVMTCSKLTMNVMIIAYIRLDFFLDCARDERIFKNSGTRFNLRCRNDGNYDPVQDQNGKVFCVDQYGYAVSGLLTPDPDLVCDKYLYDIQEDFFADDDLVYY